ncbi:MAG: HesA/MoeB/ThiF family protein [Muribaculaceae bacterium]|nr:HesA/MoeB/ThiF family protein [Muribaculaceae bacterium]
MDSRYSRQMLLPEIGEEGQHRLREASVLVVGLGGLGCPVCLYLTGAGVGRLGLCDTDEVSLSNLHRQLLYSERTIGVPKTVAARDRLAAISSGTRFDLHPDGLTPGNGQRLVKDYDLVIDCTDNHATRYLIEEICSRCGKPWIHGAISEFSGHVATFMPGHPGYSEIFPDKEALSSLPKASGGVFTPLPGLVGTLQAAEALKLICGMEGTLVGRILLINLKNLTFNTVEL